MSEPSAEGDECVHEVVYYDHAPQLVAVAAPLLRQALDRGEDVALACSDPTNRALRDALTGDDQIPVLPRADIYTKAVSAVSFFRDFVEERVAAGAPRVSIIGEVDFGTAHRALDEWRRYEALLNHAMAPFPLRALCAYDTRRVPQPVLTAAELTHPHLRRPHGQVSNPRYVDPAELLREVDSVGDAHPGIDPVLTIPEVVDLGGLHSELRSLLSSDSMPRERVEDLVMAVHEVVTNGLRHGQPPVSVQVWLSPGHVSCSVTDRGTGFDDPFTGYIRGGGKALSEGQYGLWLTRQLCDEVFTARTDAGFTTQLTMHH